MSPARKPRLAKQDLSLWAAKLQAKLVAELEVGRAIHSHPVAMGDSAEERWRKTLALHLPRRYAVDRAFVIDAEGQQSEQLDVVIYDPLYSACLVDIEGCKYIPAESVYCVLEVKQSLEIRHLRYAGEKVESVRRLTRTNAKIRQPHMAGAPSQREPFDILGGILTLDAPKGRADFREKLRGPLSELGKLQRLDLGCVANRGGFEVTYNTKGEAKIDVSPRDASLMFFLLRLIARLQDLGTANPIDYARYAAAISRAD